jgi:predicted  nucleic acid-binding Zn-ribbon protein
MTYERRGARAANMTRGRSNQSKKIDAWLRELSELDVAVGPLNPNAPDREAALERINSLREIIPTSMLHHYDHLKSRGKRSVAPVRRGVCGSCHLAFPSGSLGDLRKKSETLNVCVNCGAFVYLDEQDDDSQVANSSDRRRKNAAANRNSARRRSVPKSRKVRSTR